jgi:membrane-bound serine protease (ClpP class)
MRYLILVVILIIQFAIPVSAEGEKVLLVKIKDFISSATVEHMGSAVDIANEECSAILMILDTPGGSLDATLKIIEHIQRSDVPVIGYVYPSGKSAWSAGTILLLASDYAAMAPFTTIGSAQPVLGTQPINDTKIINALVEKVITLAQLHDRNATQATRFITHNDNLTPEEALDFNVIEAIANEPNELLMIADGSKVNTLHGEKILDTKGASIIIHEKSIRVIIMHLLSDPLLSTVMLTIGFFALIYGLTAPGFGGEIAGATLIILGLLGQGFDVNWVALALLATGTGLLIYELYNPGFDAMGIAGIIILLLGTSLMITQPVRPLLIPSENLGNMFIATAMIIAPLAAFLGFVTYKIWRIKGTKSLEFTYQDQYGVAIDPISKDKEGFVLVGGEYWKARSNHEIKKGEKIKIVNKKGSIVEVEPIITDQELE